MLYYAISSCTCFVLCILYQCSSSLCYNQINFSQGAFIKGFNTDPIAAIYRQFVRLLPDIPAVYNLIVNGNSGHCWIGPVPTHSLLFSFSAILFGTLAGLIAYGKFSKAIYLGIFAEAAFLSHLCWMMLMKEVVITCIQYTRKVSAYSH